MKVGIIILCRYSSSRLPGKILKEIKGKAILENIYLRLKGAKSLKNIVVATSSDESDDRIAEFCQDHSIPYFRGSLENVSERFLECALSNDFDYAIRINGDNVLIDTNTIETMVKNTIETKLDFCSNVPERTFPYGMSIEIVKTDFYQKCFEKFSHPDHYEHVTKYIYDHLQNYDNTVYYKNIEYPELRGLQMAVDTHEDLEKIKGIANNLEGFPVSYSMKDISNIINLKKKMNTWKGKHGPLLIAEIGGNHEGDFDYAVRLTQLAIESNVDYIKFQIYTGDTLVNPVENPIRNKHFKKFELTNEQHQTLAKMCKDANVGYMASIWNPDFVSELGLDKHSDIYKIGSGDFTAYPVIKKFVEFRKPLLLSTGLSNLQEVIDTVNFIQDLDEKYKDPEMLAVLQCTSMYPIPFSAANLSTMHAFRKELNLPIGYSDHTEGSYALEIAVAMGAEILEFHFTDSRENKTFRDHKVSLTKSEVHDLIEKINQINALKGDGIKVCLEEEENHLISFRRALYLNKDLMAGDTIKEEDIIALRPNHGIDARDYSKLPGKTLLKDIKKFEKLDFKNLK